ncbi:MAG TPA: MFS transporter [Terriglobales bacterium]|nr:MFS transporter [Terriglobales bacterium]
MPNPGSEKNASRAAFTYPNFVSYEVGRLFIVLALEMQSVAVGWQVYDITKRPLDLGLVGLAQFLPGIFLFLISGQVADRLDRRHLLLACYGGFAVCSALLLEIAWRGTRSVHAIYMVLVLLGVVRSFNGPAGRALLPQLVPEEHFPSAVAWNASVFQSATIMGPVVGGLIYAAFRGPTAVYATAMAAGAVAFFALSRLKHRMRIRRKEPLGLGSVLAGFRYVWQQKLILGSISLDMFAVLLGGAVALLPVYAREILHTGPWGLGLLRSAPGVGAGTMALLLAQRPLRGRVGATMLWCVAGFGVFTIVFGLSRSMVISLLALALVGATDMVSVVIRGTLVQLATPDEMRGRVNAIDMLFIGTSNEFGQFESGITAQWFGTVPAVVLGGIGTLVVIAIWAWRFPELRQADQITSVQATPEGVGAENL